MHKLRLINLRILCPQFWPCDVNLRLSDAYLTSTWVSMSHLIIISTSFLTVQCTWLLNKWNLGWKKSPLTTAFQFPSSNPLPHTGPSGRPVTHQQGCCCWLGGSCSSIFALCHRNLFLIVTHMEPKLQILIESINNFYLINHCVLNTLPVREIPHVRFQQITMSVFNNIWTVSHPHITFSVFNMWRNRKWDIEMFDLFCLVFL